MKETSKELSLATWPLNGSEAGGDLVLLQTPLLLLCKTSCSNANLVYLHATSSLAAIKRPAHRADNGKMVYSTLFYNKL